MNDLETTMAKETEIHKLSERLHGKEEVSKVGKEIEEMWKRCGDAIDEGMKQIARAKISHHDLMTLMGENKHYLN